MSAGKDGNSAESENSAERFVYLVPTKLFQ